MQAQASSGHKDGIQVHSLAELLECPPATGDLLKGAMECLRFGAGETVFRQSEACRGLYLVVGGLFQRRTERLETRLTLGPARAGDLVELAAVLGDGLHTYTLTSQSDESALMLLPIQALTLAFESYPALRMRLLEELAREVSRAYGVLCLRGALRPRRRPAAGLP